jgi:hypothetical protein
MPRYSRRPDDFTGLLRDLGDRSLDNKPVKKRDVKNGYYAVRDDAGHVRVAWGKFADGKYGIRVYGPTGTVLFDQSAV